MIPKKVFNLKGVINRNQKTEEPQPVAQSTTSRMIYIRVLLQSFVFPTTTSSRHLYLIQGSIDDIGRYAGTTVDWIIKVANSICDPAGAGQVYTHTVGTVCYWQYRDRNVDWRQVVPGDPLLPGIYEFVSPHPITLSKISERQSHSVTSIGSESSAAAFRQHLDLRDGGGCVVTRSAASVIPSHLIPKRMGTDGAKEVVTRFEGAQAAHDIHRFHPSIGVLLLSTLDTLVDDYNLGFFHVSVSLLTV